MIEIELDGKKVEISEGSMVMHAADKAGTYIPHFCYHKKLSIAANCRMCLVDVEKMPKPMPACATPVTQGMIVRTKSDKAIKAQKSVMEFCSSTTRSTAPSATRAASASCKTWLWATAVRHRVTPKKSASSSTRTWAR